jgi:DNA-binding NarL/FixJ family response regulator
VTLIVAAASDDVQRELVRLAQAAQFDVSAVTRDPTTLAALLQPAVGEWIVTGGRFTQARPFLVAARAAKAAAVAVLFDRTDEEDRLDLAYGGLAVLRAIPRDDAFLAAAMASRAGLSAWDPDLDPSPEATDSIETPLSPRERTVLELTGEGLSTKAVARQLGISPNTVKFHLHAAFDKLGVNSRAEAVMAAIRRGELSV